jgi:DNA-binding transcriptional MerR regulator
MEGRFGVNGAELSIKEVAEVAGTTSRRLRHYDQPGLRPPSRVAATGHCYYDQECLTRLQQILPLRDLGLGLSSIREVLNGQKDTETALQAHLDLLEREVERLRPSSVGTG